MTDRIHTDQAEALRKWVEEQKVPKKMMREGPLVYAVASGKGGVGKSNVSVNLAYQLGNMGKKTLLFDADFGLGNTDILLGVSPELTLEELLYEGGDLEQIAVPLNEKVVLIPSGSGKFALAQVDPLLLESVFIDLEKFAGHFDCVIVDTGAGLSEQVRKTLLFSDKILIVTTPDPASLTDSYATIKMVARQDPDKKFAVVVNMTEKNTQGDEIFSQLSYVADKYLGVSLEYWGSIPKDRRVPEAIRKQKAVSQCFPGTEASLALMKLASILVDEPKRPRSAEFGGFIRQFFGGDLEEVSRSINSR